MISAQRVTLVKNPSGVLVLVHAEGRVVKSTCADYIGMSVGDARCAATAVMRYWDAAAQDHLYPETVEVDA